MAWCFWTALPQRGTEHREQQPGRDEHGAIRLWLDPQLTRAGEHPVASDVAVPAETTTGIDLPCGSPGPSPMADSASRGSSTRCCRAGFLKPGAAIPTDESAAKRPSHSAACRRGNTSGLRMRTSRWALAWIQETLPLDCGAGGQLDEYPTSACVPRRRRGARGTCIAVPLHAVSRLIRDVPSPARNPLHLRGTAVRAVLQGRRHRARRVMTRAVTGGT